MKPLGAIADKINALHELCLRHSVQQLYAFGSVATEYFNAASSDIDLIAILEPMSPLEKGEHLINLWTALEHLFGRKVDLLTDQPIENPYLRKEIEQTKRLIYNRESQEIPF